VAKVGGCGGVAAEDPWAGNRGVLAWASGVRAQARIVLPQSLREVIDAVRMRWNPEVATGNPAHVTVVYHDEAPDLSMLQRRLGEICRSLSPFELSGGRPRQFAPPVRGAFLEVSDPDGQVQGIRQFVLQSPLRARPHFGLHVTLLHPDQGDRIEAAWASLSEFRAPGTFTVRSVELVSGSGADAEILAAFDLG